MISHTVFYVLVEFICIFLCKIPLGFFRVIFEFFSGFLGNSFQVVIEFYFLGFFVKLFSSFSRVGYGVSSLCFPFICVLFHNLYGLVEFVLCKIPLSFFRVIFEFFPGFLGNSFQVMIEFYVGFSCKVILELFSSCPRVNDGLSSLCFPFICESFWDFLQLSSSYH